MRRARRRVALALSDVQLYELRYRVDQALRQIESCPDEALAYSITAELTVAVAIIGRPEGET